MSVIKMSITKVSLTKMSWIRLNYVVFPGYCFQNVANIEHIKKFLPECVICRPHLKCSGMVLAGNALAYEEDVSICFYKFTEYYMQTCSVVLSGGHLAAVRLFL